MTLIDDAFASTAPGNSAVADTASAGSTLVAARADHRHGRENFGSPSSVGAANANGSATTLVRSDHVHGLGAASLGSITNMTGAAGSDGVATTASRSDHMHGFAFSSQAAGDLFYATSSTALTRLAIAAATNVLIGGGSAPAWSGAGSALALLRTNAAGNAAEWGTAGQIAFPATQNASADANTLDDYEEGTWTPSVGGNATYTAQAGLYTKIGRLIAIEFVLAINVLGTGSATAVAGLPFVVTITSGLAGASYWNGLAASIVYLGYITSTTTIVLYSATAAATGLGNTSILGNSADIRGASVYSTS